ncbi:AHH domain-containing protein [Myxococcus sp. AM011]|uniref:AHH domain-containing protein n=1 Tax=Myxococcus sp. AM011 TaxID=2745200 RepID=UPI001595CF3D|nr:AHH domain-containing protein [Myxococcus sp. AM011]NVJ21250.1 AHH domain-containing protein [Myxococcus sp. AM011]
MRVLGVLALLLLAGGCASTRVVRLDTGGGKSIAYTPIETEPVEMDEEEFKGAVARLVPDLRLDAVFKEVDQEDRRSSSVSHGSGGDGALGRAVSSAHERVCQRQEDPMGCLGMMTGGLTLGPMERRMLALYFAFDGAWDDIEEDLRGTVNVAALRGLVTTMSGTALKTLVAPEPMTKPIALAWAASLIAYLGTEPVWKLGQGFSRLVEESRDAASFEELERVGHRFGDVLGDNGARVLVVVSLSVLGGRNAMAVRGPKMPGFAQAAIRAQTEAGFQLAGALSGDVRSIALTSGGELKMTLAPTAVAAVAMGPGAAPMGTVGGIPGDAEGTVHPICAGKGTASESDGGPWAQRCQELFIKAGMRPEDPANLIRIKGHRGPHPEAYHARVFELLNDATGGCRDAGGCRAALTRELARVARELVTKGTELRTLVTRNAEE